MYQGFPKMRSPLFDKNVRKADFVHMEATPRFELGVELLQSSALPLGYVAIWITGNL